MPTTVEELGNAPATSLTEEAQRAPAGSAATKTWNLGWIAAFGVAAYYFLTRDDDRGGGGGDPFDPSNY